MHVILLSIENVFLQIKHKLTITLILFYLLLLIIILFDKIYFVGVYFILNRIHYTVEVGLHQSLSE